MPVTEAVIMVLCGLFFGVWVTLLVYGYWEVKAKKSLECRCWGCPLKNQCVITPSKKKSAK